MNAVSQQDGVSGTASIRRDRDHDLV